MKPCQSCLKYFSILTLFIFVSCAGLLGPNIKPAQKLTDAGDHQGALAHYKAIIEAGEANASVYRLAYESAFRSGKRVTAESYYNQALENGFDTDSLNTLAVNLWYDRALMVMGSDNWSEADKAVDKLKVLAPDAKETKFCGLVIAGKEKYDRGNHKGLWDAINNFTKASALDPSSGLPHYLMAKTRYKNDRNDYDAALEDYYEALRVEPDGLFVAQAKAEIKKIEATKAKMRAFWGK